MKTLKKLAVATLLAIAFAAPKAMQAANNLSSTAKSWYPAVISKLTGWWRKKESVESTRVLSIVKTLHTEWILSKRFSPELLESIMTHPDAIERLTKNLYFRSGPTTYILGEMLKAGDREYASWLHAQDFRPSTGDGIKLLKDIIDSYHSLGEYSSLDIMTILAENFDVGVDKNGNMDSSLLVPAIGKRFALKYLLKHGANPKELDGQLTTITAHNLTKAIEEVKKE